ncbi:hypothetical protein MBANPS3_004900 [Mucor bainieri]
MSPPWTTLPQELVRKVFSETDHRNILELQHVCQAWRPAAQERLYTFITITASGESRREQRLVQSLSSSGSKARNFVKNIRILPLVHNKSLNLTSLEVICSLCPNVTSIKFTPSSRQIYQIIYQLCEAQHLQKLQCITAPWKGIAFDYNLGGDFEGYLHDYCKLMLLLKNSATEITICSKASAAISEHSSIMEAFPLAKHLKTFVCLEKIVIIPSAYLTLTQFGELLDMCSSTKVRAVKLIPRSKRRLLSTASQVHVQPQKTFSSVKELTLDEMVLLTDQDLQWIMEKFPALHHLFVRLAIPKYGAYSDDNQRSIQSADTAIAFVKYLWRIPHFDFEGFKTTSEIMSKVISQISKCDYQVNTIDLQSTNRDELLDLPTLAATSKTSLTNTIQLRIPPHMKSLFKHATQAFSSQANALYLQGSTVASRRTINLPLDTRTKAESKALVRSLEYAIDNYTRLKSVSLDMVTLPSRYFNSTTFNRRWRLDKLHMMRCSKNAGIWNILSKRLEHVENFEADWYHCNTLFEAGDLYMPHTTFQDICLKGYPFRFVKVCTDATTMYIDFEGSQSDEDQSFEDLPYEDQPYEDLLYEDQPYEALSYEDLSDEDQITQLTEQEYNAIRLRSATPNEYCQRIVSYQMEICSLGFN